MKKSFGIISALVICAAVLLCGCADTTDSQSGSLFKDKASGFSQNEAGGGQENGGASNASDGSAKVDSFVTDLSNLFSDRDLRQTVETAEAESIALESGKTIDIDKAGIYLFSGEAADCTIRVNASDDDKVQLVLDGVSITNKDFACIYVVNADKVFITTSDSENYLSVTGQFVPDGDVNVDAVIFSKDDIVLNGVGTLTVNSAYGNGVTGKDDMKITGGSYAVTSAKDGFEANDSLHIADGSFTVSSQKDAFHCENNDDNTVGDIYVASGSFNIISADDGMQATTVLQIDGGEFNIKAVEGLEATYVQINGGTIYIEASDDGINASRKSTALDIVVEINGGDITIIMGAGDTDAVDANGSIYVNGGNINITANSAFDYDVKGELNGGTVYINGEQVTELPQSMMGGHGGMGGFGGNGGMGGFRDNGGEGFERGDKFSQGGERPDKNNMEFGGDGQDFHKFDSMTGATPQGEPA